MSFRSLVNQAQDANAEYLHIVSGTQPKIQTRKGVETLSEQKLIPSEVYQLVDECLTPEAKQKLLTGDEVLICHNHDSDTELRVHVYKQRGTLALSAKFLDTKIDSLSHLGISDEMIDSLVKQRSGLLISSSQRNSGRSSLALSYLQEIATLRSVHIVSCEEVIEKRFSESLKGLITRCQYNEDILDLSDVIKGFWSTDLQVCFLDSLDDPVRFRSAVELATRGVLVVGTIMAENIEMIFQKIFRISAEDQTFRQMVANTLGHIIHQTRLHDVDGKNHFIREFFYNQAATRQHIRESRLQPLISFMRSVGNRGCQSYQRAYEDLVLSGAIQSEEIPKKYQ